MWSPRLDEVGNSVRAVHAATELVDRINIHNFEVTRFEYHPNSNPNPNPNPSRNSHPNFTLDWRFLRV